MYPNIIIAFNIAQNTMVGKIIIKLNGEEDNDLYVEMLNANNIEDLSELKDLGSEFLDDLQVGDILHICSKWFKLPNIVDLINDAHEEFATQNKKVVTFTAKDADLKFEETHIINVEEAV